MPRSDSAAEQFASGFTESLTSPINGAAELFADRQLNRAGEQSFAKSAGEMLGSAAAFVATTAVVRRFLPGRLAPIVAGGLLGGLGETENNTVAERFQNAALGASTVSVLEFAPGALSKIGVKGSIQQIGLAGGAAGILHTQGDSFIRTGHAADLAETLTGAGMWAGTGAAFAKAGSLWNAQRRNQSFERAETEYNKHFTQIPGLDGSPGGPNSRLNVVASSELAQTYAKVTNSVGRVEVLAHNGKGVEGRYGTVFSVTDDGMMMTANHVVKNAVDVTVFDANLRAHSARVVKTNEPMDLAVLQLTGPRSSFDAFKPLKFSNTEPTSDVIASAFGHPNGWRDLYAAPGRLLNSARPHIQLRYSMMGIEGFSGAPIVANGAVESVFVQGPRSSVFEAYATPAKHASKLLDDAIQISTPAANESSFHRPKLNLRLIKAFDIHDKSAATSNLERMFGSNFTQERAPEFFHSKVKTVPMPGTESGALTMKMQYLPAENQVVISPIAIDGKTIPDYQTWVSNSRLAVKDAKLVVELAADGTPRRMVSYDDPANILQQGFNYRGTDNYLATLQQHTIPKWMQLLPERLRFERLVARS